MAILITGVSGFIGRYLAKEFLKKKYKVYGVYRKNKPKIKNKNFRPLKIDLTRKFIIPNDINSIFHLAADSPENVNSINLINNNIKSTKNLINSVKNIKIKNFYFFSSIAVYEKFKNKRVLLKEKLKNLNPISNYSKSKYLSEKLIIKKIDKTINLLVFRLPAVVAKDSFLSAFYNIKKKIKNNELLTIINPNQKFNGIIHISDLIRIIISIFEKKKTQTKLNTINVASQNPEKFKDVIMQMYKLLKKKKKYHLKNHQFTNLISINNLKKFKLKIPTVKQSIKKFILI